MNQKRKRVTSIHCQYIKIVFRLKIFCSRQGSSIRGKVHQLRSRLVHPMRGVIFCRTSFRTNDDNMGTCSCSYLEPKQSKNMIALSFLCTKLKSSTIQCAKFQNRKTGAYFLQETRIQGDSSFDLNFSVKKWVIATVINSYHRFLAALSCRRLIVIYG